VIEAPFEHARRAVEAVVSVKQLVRNGWLRLMVIDPESKSVFIHKDDGWHEQPCIVETSLSYPEESRAS
jgi:hypothetical protein